MWVNEKQQNYTKFSPMKIMNQMRGCQSGQSSTTNLKLLHQLLLYYWWHGSAVMCWSRSTYLIYVVRSYTVSTGMVTISVLRW